MRRSRGLWAFATMLLGVVLIGVATLFPYTFEFRAISEATFFASFKTLPSSPLDLPKNILLFLPFGTGLALVLELAGVRSAKRALLVVLAGFFVSLTVESLQIFLSGRTSNLSDLVSNSIGSLCGIGILKSARSPRSCLSIVNGCITSWRASAFLLTYSLWALAAAFLLMAGLSPRGWNPGYYVNIGNEADGKWPWRGSVLHAFLIGRGVSSVEADLLLNGVLTPDLSPVCAAAYPDVLRPTNLADSAVTFAWVGTPRIGPEGAVVSEESWLQTPRPLHEYAQGVNNSRGFTIAFRGRTFDLGQASFPRIITFSANDEDTNVMLSQHGDALEVRWRSVLSGDGTTPQIYFQNFFLSTNVFSAVLSFRHNVVNLYTSNGLAATVCLGPEIAFEALCRDWTQWLVNLSARSFLSSAFLFGFFLCGPLAWCVAIRERSRCTWRFEWVMLAVLPLVLEACVGLHTGHPLRGHFVGVELLVAITTLLVARRIAAGSPAQDQGVAR